MSGDMAPIGGIMSLCENHGASLIVDEAHSVGVFGASGKGIMDHLPVSETLCARVITFGKAFGAHGAAILCSTKMKEFLVNFSRPFIYTTALPPSAYQLIQDRVLEQEIDFLRNELQTNIKVFRNDLSDHFLGSEINSPIQMLYFNSRQDLIDCSEELAENGLKVKAIFAPTVSESKRRIEDQHP